ILISSPEGRAQTIRDEQVDQMYRQLLGRPNGSEGDGSARFWSRQLRAGLSIQQVAANIVNAAPASQQAAAKAALPNLAIPDDNTMFVGGLYHKLLGRVLDQSGYNFYVRTAMQQGATDAQIASVIADSDEGRVHALNELFSRYLKRSLRPDELQPNSYWVLAIASRRPERLLILDIVLTH